MGHIYSARGNNGLCQLILLAAIACLYTFLLLGPRTMQIPAGVGVSKHGNDSMAAVINSIPEKHRVFSELGPHLFDLFW